jgi:hypothetical protein
MQQHAKQTIRKCILKPPTTTKKDKYHHWHAIKTAAHHRLPGLLIPSLRRFHLHSSQGPSGWQGMVSSILQTNMEEPMAWHGIAIGDPIL